MQRRDFHRLLGASALGLSALGPAFAQEAFPGKPITMVVPFPPGGVADVVGRPVAEAMARHFNQSVVVVNRSGAGGAIGMAAVAKAPADGYTVLMALSSLVVLPEADRILNRPPQFEVNQLAPIARMTADPTVLVVRADSPWKTYAEFIAFAKANPGRISFGSSGNYGTMQVPMEQLKAATGTFMLHVPYTGAGPAIVGLLGGQVDALASGPASIVGHIKSGRMRALAHWGEGRLALLPDVPSFKELGVNIGYSQWAGLFAPAGTPQPVIDKLREAARAAARDERTVQILTTAGTQFQYQDAADFDAFVKADAAAMKSVVQRIGKVN